MHDVPSRDPDAEAIVRLLAAAEGGRSSPVTSGYRPAHAIRDDYLTTAEHVYLDREVVAPGESARAHLRFITPEFYPNTLWVGRELAVQEGARVVGFATITQVFNPVLARHV